MSEFDASTRAVLPAAAELQLRFDLLNERVSSGAEADGWRSSEARELLRDLCLALEEGSLRMVEGNGLGQWHVRVWVKRALMTLSGGGVIAAQPGLLPGSELDSLGWSALRPNDRRVPAGSFIRRGAYLAPGVTVMPPSTVQAGAAILEGANIDSHVLVGTAVLVGEGAVVGCGTMLAGALQPEEALPVILERGVVVGGNCGLYGSIVVGERASIFAGTVIRSATGMYHVGRRTWTMPDGNGTLRLANGASVSMGVPPAEAFSDGIQRLAPLIAD